jgi:hypothetical protein
MTRKIVYRAFCTEIEEEKMNSIAKSSLFCRFLSESPFWGLLAREAAAKKSELLAATARERRKSKYLLVMMEFFTENLLSFLAWSSFGDMRRFDVHESKAKKRKFRRISKHHFSSY